MTVIDTVKGALGLGEDLAARDRLARERADLIDAPAIRKSLREQREAAEAEDERLVASLRAERDAAIGRAEIRLRATVPRELDAFRRWIARTERECLWIQNTAGDGSPILRRRSATYEHGFTQREPRAEWLPLPVRDVTSTSTDAGWLQAIAVLLLEARRAAEGPLVFMTHDAMTASIREFRTRIDALRESEPMQPLDDAAWKLIAPAKERGV